MLFFGVLYRKSSVLQKFNVNNLQSGFTTSGKNNASEIAIPKSLVFDFFNEIADPFFCLDLKASRPLSQWNASEPLARMVAARLE